MPFGVSKCRATRRRRCALVAAARRSGASSVLLIGQADGGEVVEEHRLGRPVHRQKRSARVARAAAAAGAARCRARCAPRSALRQQPLVDRAGPPVPGDARILAVAGQQLVAAFAGQDDRDVVARQRRDEVERHARRVRDRLVLVPHQLRQRAEEVAVVDDDLVRFGADGARDLPRVLELAERALLERDRERLERPVDQPRHERRDRAAVDAAGQEHAERHVRHQAQADGLLRAARRIARRRCPDRTSARPAAGLARGHVPVLPRRDRAVLEDQQVPGQQLADAAEQRVFAGGRARAEHFGQRGPVRSRGSISPLARIALISEPKSSVAGACAQ